jgi:hypothetical protein
LLSPDGSRPDAGHPENMMIVDLWLSEPDDGIYEAMNKKGYGGKRRLIFFLGAMMFF